MWSDAVVAVGAGDRGDGGHDLELRRVQLRVGDLTGRLVIGQEEVEDGRRADRELAEDDRCVSVGDRVGADQVGRVERARQVHAA